MAPAKKSSAFGADIAFNPDLRNCLVNIPAPLANAIGDRSDVKIQHVVVEVGWNAPPAKENAKLRRRVVGAGWTGMPSMKQQSAALDSRGKPGKAPEVLEIDPTYARINGIENGQRVRMLIAMHAHQALIDQ